MEPVGRLAVPDLPAPPQSLHDLVVQGVAEGILSEGQGAALLRLASQEAAAIAPAVPAVDAATRVRAWVAEALGYVGAALAVVAGLVLAQQFWADLAAWAQVSVLAVVAVALLGAGASVRGDPGTPQGRLGSFLWAAAAVAVGGAAGVFGSAVLEASGADVAVWASAPATVTALVLWRLRVRSLQQVMVAAGLAATGMSVLARVEPGLLDWGGLLVWSFGVAWFLLAWGELIRPVRTAVVLGAIGSLIAPTFVATGRWALVLGLLTAGALIGASIAMRVTALLGLGVAGLFLYVPRIVFEFFGDELGAPVALLVSGVVLIAVSLWVARMRPHQARALPPEERR